MERKEFIVQDIAGNAIRGASVLVKTYPGGVNATLYADDGVTPIANPLTTDSTGQCWAKAANGHYSKTVSKTGITTETTNDIIFFDLTDYAATLVASTGAALVGWIQAGVSAVARLVRDKLRERISFEDFGAVGDGTTDDAAAINAAITAAAGIFGGNVYATQGKTYAIGSVINVSSRGVVLVGHGGDVSHDVGVNTGTAAKLKWIGSAGGTMVKFSPTTGASAQGLAGCGIKGFALLAQNSAAIALLVESVRFGEFKNLYIDNPTTVAVDVGVVATLGEARDTQHCVFNQISVRVLEATAAIGLRLGGDSGANASFNKFSNITISHENGDAVVLNTSDNNVLQQIQCVRPTGTGRTLLLNGSNTNPGPAFGNFIESISGPGAILSKGTSSFTYPAANNHITYLDKGNGTPDPTIETGSTLFWSTDTGVGVLQGFSKTALADSVAQAIATRLSIGNESVRIHNGSSNHVILTDGTRSWSVNIDGATGDLRFIRLTGSGNVALPSVTTLSGQLITIGAADSGGAGFRVLRVPN